ncbi:hypothetical protein ILYODFUR_004027 [Ilyodon furcidens]|uniref:Uncharacterized protein n=1 Tax=Ilyodon furcidens TaxID=33524 RepID=A0ABV0UNV9_9TELE
MLSQVVKRRIEVPHFSPWQFDKSSQKLPRQREFEEFARSSKKAQRLTLQLTLEKQPEMFMVNPQTVNITVHRPRHVLVTQDLDSFPGYWSRVGQYDFFGRMICSFYWVNYLKMSYSLFSLFCLCVKKLQEIKGLHFV